LYVPEGQTVALTDDASGQNEPNGQATGSGIPGKGQNVPMGQARQVEFEDAPAELLYVPGGQYDIALDIIGQ
jgi:hypothetical protein